MPRSGPIAEFRNPTGAAGAGAVAAEHLRGGPSVELHEVALGAAPVEPGVAEVVPEPVRVHVDAALAAAPDDDLVDPAGCHGPPVADPEPQLRPVRLGVPGADAEVPVEAAGGVEADLDDPGLAALAVDGDLPVPQVHVAAPRVVSVVPDSGQLRQADPGRPEHGDQGGVAALRERAARAGALQPWQVPCGEDRDGLVGDAGRLQPGHGVGDLVLGGEPLEELLEGTVLVAGVRGAVPVQQPHNPPLDVLLADLFPAGEAGLPAQVGSGEPLHRLDIGPYCLAGLPLGGQVQPERADLCMKSPSVQLLGLPGPRLRCGHGLALLVKHTILSS